MAVGIRASVTEVLLMNWATDCAVVIVDHSSS